MHEIFSCVRCVPTHSSRQDSLVSLRVGVCNQTIPRYGFHQVCRQSPVCLWVGIARHKKHPLEAVSPHTQGSDTGKIIRNGHLVNRPELGIANQSELVRNQCCQVLICDSSVEMKLSSPMRNEHIRRHYWRTENGDGRVRVGRDGRREDSPNLKYHIK